jgi:hypothetical protein
MWGGIILFGYFLPIYEKEKRLKKVSLGALRLAGNDIFMDFFSSDSREVCLGKVEFKNNKWQVYITSGQSFFEYNHRRLSKRVEKMAQEKYPKG